MTDKPTRSRDKLRDRRRRRGWFHVDNELINVYGPQIGANGIAVYNVLCCYADGNQQSFPGVLTIAALISRSDREVQNALKLLEKNSLIAITPRYRAGTRERLSNLYTVLDIHIGGENSSPRGENSSPQVVNIVWGNNNHSEQDPSIVVVDGAPAHEKAGSEKKIAAALLHHGVLPSKRTEALVKRLSGRADALEVVADQAARISPTSVKSVAAVLLTNLEKLPDDFRPGASSVSAGLASKHAPGAGRVSRNGRTWRRAQVPNSTPEEREKAREVAKRHLAEKKQSRDKLLADREKWLLRSERETTKEKREYAKSYLERIDAQLAEIGQAATSV